MQADIATLRKFLSEDLMAVMIRVGLIAFVVLMCLRIFAPFAPVMLWALVLAVALYPVQRRLASRLGGRQGRAATILVVVGLLLIGVPTVMLGTSFATHVHDTYAALKNNAVTVPQPAPGVADWPIVGERLHRVWQAAATDLPAFLETLQPQLANFAKWLLSMAASTAGAVLLFLGSLIIAGVMLAYGESGSQAMRGIFSSLAGATRGPDLQRLSTATVRSVATGVVGVAFIQALLLGIGFLLAGVPAAGVLALVVLLMGIMQLPATLVSLPVIAYLWLGTDASTLSNILFTVYLVV
ncbi:MAG: hypothetical protein RLZ44_1076, partial [Pseudomonadota bacterium]